ncbi:MAG: helix-turn-helix transcriptional regulator [Candidatus Hermodarchaeota archaeon]
MTSESKLASIIGGTRRTLLESLLVADANAVTLAQQLGVHISAVRSHLDVLEVAGLISSRHKHAKRGRPKRIYFLTASARTLFPQQSARIFSLLLQAIARSLGVKTSTSLIRQLVTSLWEQILPEKPSGTLKDRLSRVVHALDAFGFYASFKEFEGQFVIVLRNDVFGEAFSEVPQDLADQFYQEFWNHLARILERVQIQRREVSEPGEHGYQLYVVERGE